MQLQSDSYGTPGNKRPAAWGCVGDSEQLFGDQDDALAEDEVRQSVHCSTSEHDSFSKYQSNLLEVPMLRSDAPYWTRKFLNTAVVGDGMSAMCHVLTQL